MDKKIDGPAQGIKSKRQRQILSEANQPMTVSQIARKSALSLNWSSDCLRNLRDRKLFRCFNSDAGMGRIYWLTRRGRRAQETLYSKKGLRTPKRFCPAVDWNLYGRVCSSHRSAVIMAMDGGMKLTEIRMKACKENKNLRMSISNCRDVVSFLTRYYILRRGLTDPSIFKLSGLGRKFRKLLFRVYRPEILERRMRIAEERGCKLKRLWNCWCEK